MEVARLASCTGDGEADAVANGGGDGRGTASVADDGSRAPRLPRWTRQEILVLIKGKRVAENRDRRGGRMAGSVSGQAAVEPKWISVSSYCRRHGVNRGPVQCRKRWSNLAGDFKKIKEWESGHRGDPAESFWVMRNDLRRDHKLPGFFDKEVFDILDGATASSSSPPPPLSLALPSSPRDKENDEALFDSGRSAAAAAATEDGLFSDFEASMLEEAGEKVAIPTPTPMPTNVPAPIPTSAGMTETDEEHPTSNPEMGSPSQAGRKRKQAETGRDWDNDTSSLHQKLIGVLERNGRMLGAQLEAQNNNCQLDREQRKDQADSLVAALNKFADALWRIADKL